MQIIYVRIGSTNSSSGGTQYQATSFYAHPGYNSRTSDYDAGVVRIRGGMNLDGTNARAIPLVNVGYDPKEGAEVILTGWGATSQNGSTSNTLMVVQVPVVSRTQCNEILRNSITNRMFCAGLNEGGKDTCQGDSGGPAVTSSSNRLAGITCFGFGCAQPDSPGVYTLVGAKSYHKIGLDDGNDEKIVGGEETTIPNHPYQAFLKLYDGEDYYGCGGSIVSKYYVVTAAHCLARMQKIYLRIGSTQKYSGGTEYETTTFYSHPRYKSPDFDYDVGVVNIPKGMDLDGTNASTIRLVGFGNDPQDGEDVTLTGWGDTAENGTSSNILRVVEVPIVNRTRCNELLNYRITSRMFCAGTEEGGKDTCQGDSGGPAVINSSGQLAGIISFGFGCGQPNSPGVYTRVGNMEIRFYLALFGL
ncbi:unnamed protein product [Arctia plantaginis]|uniref:Peptidase S1 domain-containing protein n=1 Tax=Arctia plantaginis TaxID=874455 RepID=A0A8S0Z9A0_ARCPL|nr:unnamed protein product [Arctia plantaginis]